MTPEMAENVYWEWDAALSVGIKSIDDQHRRLVDYINELEQALRKNDDAGIGRIVDQMVDYTVTHFEFEEALMEKCGYQGLAAHRTIHQNFTNRVAYYKGRSIAGLNVGPQLLTELRSWPTGHIMREDQNYSETVRAALDEGWVAKTVRRLFRF